MWLKWLPWRFVVRSVARKHRFLDPFALMSRLQRFSQPSEVAAPTELLRSGAVIHARGLMNSQAIQHNLDWIWPFWVERQFDPTDKSFVPRAFSITHINLTHRNWTAVGLPDTHEWPIVDPRGLVTPFHDGWSLDAWVIDEKGASLMPSRLKEVSQYLSIEGNLAVMTTMNHGDLSLMSTVEVIGDPQAPVCQISLVGYSHRDVRLAVVLRPYNPEGVSFIHDIEWQENLKGWVVNGDRPVDFSDFPEQHVFSDYHQGDVYGSLLAKGKTAAKNKKGDYQEAVHCEVGMATAVALFDITSGQSRKITVTIPLGKKTNLKSNAYEFSVNKEWEESLQGHCQLRIPDEHFQFLYDTALRTLILHSPDDVYPGPYTYKRFWFRDAAFIINAMLCAGLDRRVGRVLDKFPSRQTQFGYFLSQEGEWDSNGEALWAFQRYCQLTGKGPNSNWKKAIYKGGQWITRKRLPDQPASAHAGLLPPGFSAEHLGPNDYYYWDDFWGVAGLQAAGFLANAYGDKNQANEFLGESQEFLKKIEQSLEQVKERLGEDIIPAAPYRRMDAGAIGSIVADYPLSLYPGKNPRIMQTVEFLVRNSFVRDGFFQDMTHSGINPYLTLHVAQVLLRAGDPRYFDLMEAVAQLASPTGQWPEAVHPLTGGGCMGDGQHVWAAAEWMMMLRNCFIREDDGRLVLCSGIPRQWLEMEKELFFGPAPTPFGEVSVTISPGEHDVTVEWNAKWFAQEPDIDVCLPGFSKIRAERGQRLIKFELSDQL